MKEFMDEGYLQEINRQFLHPLGLALAVDVQEDGVKFDGIWDSRDDPEGFLFGDLSKDSNKEKAENIKTLVTKKLAYRRNKFGYSIQPIGDIPEKEE